MGFFCSFSRIRSEFGSTTSPWVRFCVNTYSGEINHRSVCAAISSCYRIDGEGRTIWIVDAHNYGKRFIVRGGEMFTAFVELQRAIHEFTVSLDPLMAKGTCVPMRS